MENIEWYSQFCTKIDDIPVFMQPWWMSAVCAGKKWDILFSYDAEGNIRAAMPYLHGKKIGLRYILMPQETQIGGILLRPDIANNLSELQAVCDDITAQLRDLHLAYYYQQYPLQSPFPILFRERGFKVKERVTYRIDDLSDLDAVISHFSKNKKRQLQKALSLHRGSGLDPESFYRFHTDCLQQQKKDISYSREFFLVLAQKAIARDQATIIDIRNADDQLLAAAFLVWDNKTLYYLIPAYSPAYKDSGASALLALEAIKEARTRGKMFDFEGSIQRGIANHYKQFGSTPTKYYSIRKYYHPIFALLLLANKIRNWCKF